MPGKRVCTFANNGQAEEFKKRYENGEGLTGLAKELGWSVPTVRRRLHELGCEIRPPGRPFPVKPVRPTIVEEPKFTQVEEKEETPDSRFTW